MLSFKDIEKREQVIKQYRKKCEHCSHIIFITPTKPKVICNWCGYINYYDEKTKFKDQVNKLRKRAM